MIKRFISFLTAFSMTLMLFTGVPINVSAAETTAVCPHTDWQEISAFPKTAGNYVLTNDITLGGTITADMGTVNICLNGHNMTSGYVVIKIEQGAVLNLYDCQCTGNITSQKKHGILNKGTLNMYGSNITMSNDVGVFNTGTFNMYGGKITNNNNTVIASTFDGGGVYSYGVFNMYDGEISGNTAYREGGGVYNIGIFNMCGGKIINNKANDGGGGVCVGENKQFTMSGGEISGNTAVQNGGGICLWHKNSTFNVSGNVTVFNNTVNSKAENICTNGLSVINVINILNENSKLGITNCTVGSCRDSHAINLTTANSADYSSSFISDNAEFEIATKESNGNYFVKLRRLHIYDSGTVTTEPTEEIEGVKTYTCTVCSKTKTEPIEKLEHTHTLTPHETVAAACTTDGSEAYWTCSGCGKIFADENGTTEINEIPTIPATGHTFSTGWTYDETHHWHAAACVHTEEINGKAEHIFVEGKCMVCQEPDPNYTQPTDTEPTVTEPPVTDPSDTEPTVTEPPVTDPSDTEPIVTQPPVTEPPITEPTVTAPPVAEPVVTNPPYIPYFPSNNTSAVSVSKEPFLQNENGKIGWDVISDDIWETPDGETVLVNMNGTTKLPKNIVSDIAGRDIDLALIMNGGFVWTVNGMSVTKAKTVDMSVRKVSKIPKSAVQEYFGDVKTVQLDLRHNGDFGFIAELTIDLGSRYDGMYANSYCYKSRKFEFGDSSEIVDGQAKLRFAHASSWLITVESSPVLEDVSSGAAAHSSGTPIDMSNPASRGITVPDFDFEKKFRISNKKRKYRILKKRRLDDLVFVF